MTEHSRKVLLGFEAAGHGDIQDTRLGRVQHPLRTLYSLAQYKMVWRLARRFAKHPRKMSWAQLEWSKNWNALKRRDVRLSQSPVSLSQVSPG
jgi:hypothetical protein